VHFTRLPEGRGNYTRSYLSESSDRYSQCTFNQIYRLHDIRTHDTIWEVAEYHIARELY